MLITNAHQKEDISILVVEDDKIIAESLRNTLAEMNYTVLPIIHRGEDIFNVLREITPNVILMDITLNGELTGIETSSKINENYDIPIIYLTAHEDQDTLDDAISTNPFGYILKPYTDVEIKIAIELAYQKHKVEQELKAAKEKAEKSDRLKTEFLAQMSHEIRTPINNIVTFISLLKEEFEDKLSGELNSSFQILDSSSKRLIRTIELILNMSRIQTGNFETKLEKLDLVTDVLEDINMEFYSRAKDKGLDLFLENKAKNSSVLADKYSLGQIFMNLLGNAVKYTNEGKIILRSYNENENVIVEVEDSGIGISEEYLPKIFEPFSQEETGYTRSFEGTGLGLSLVKKYAEINNSEIEVSSEVGKGTIFKVIVPLAKNSN